MLDLKSLLEIKYYDDSEAAFTDLKVDLGEPNTTDSADITLLADDYLYVGYYKPVNKLYFDFITANVNPNTLSFEYWNGSDWSAITAYDGTKGSTRGGFVQWEELSDQEANEVDSNEQFWYRVSASVDHSAAEYNFLGLLFSDDRDLLLENPYILESNLLMGESNHLKAHVSARDYIIQTLTNKGYKKVNASSEYERITAWDLLDIVEVRRGATYLALSNIYFNLSDGAEDQWYIKSLSYKSKSDKQLNLAVLSFDRNDNGLAESNETLTQSYSATLSR